MNPFEQYGQVHGFRHPKKPWWTADYKVTGMEGLNPQRMSSCRYWWLRSDGVKTDVFDWNSKDGPLSTAICERDLNLLTQLDLDNPMPEPKPCAGQVWRTVTDNACRDWVITSVRTQSDGKLQYMVEHDPYPQAAPQWVTHWPPGPLLLNGPGAPWMKPGFKLSGYNGWGDEDWGLK